MNSVSEIMNLLNEAAGKFPNAVSFLAGRPPDELVDPAPVQQWIDAYLSSRGRSGSERLRLGQYSDTNGIIRDIVSDFLMIEGLPEATPDNCMIVNGAQEGMLIALLGLCGGRKVALAADPTYVGFSGAAEIVGIPIETVPDDEDFVDRIISRLRVRVPQVGCIYLVPDHANPTGRILTIEERMAIIEACRKYGVTIVEDSAYRRYRYEGVHLPTIYELANGNGVVLIESFAKSLLPGLRIAVMLTGPTSANGGSLAHRWSTIKSYISVATSPLSQAALAGFLITEGNSLTSWMEPRLGRLRLGRDLLFEALSGSIRSLCRAPPKKPQGGFFQPLELNRHFTLDDCLQCARGAGVLVMPMSLFSIQGRCADVVRIAFSNVDPAAIAPAIDRFGDWLQNSQPLLHS